MVFKNGVVFFGCPCGFVDRRIQMIVPSFSALFTNTSIQVVGNQGPAFGTKLFDQLTQALVFVLAPRPFGQVVFHDRVPMVRALRRRHSPVPEDFAGNDQPTFYFGSFDHGL
jgi:hypothetical protein